MTFWMRSAPVLIAAALLTGPAQAQGPSPLPLEIGTTLFCKDDTGELQLQKYATLGTMVRKFTTRFHFILSVQTNPTALVFSNPGETPYFISFEAIPYNDGGGHSGIALLSAHVFLENAEQDLKGSGMCYFATFK